MIHQTSLLSALLVLCIIAVAIWIVMALVGDLRLRLILSTVVVVVVLVAAFGLLR